MIAQVGWLFAGLFLHDVAHFQDAEPGDKFGGSGGLAYGVLAHGVEFFDELIEELIGIFGSLAQLGFGDGQQLVLIGEGDVVKHAAAEEGIGEVFLRVAGHDDDDPLLGVAAHGVVVLLLDLKFVAFDFGQDVIGEIAGCLVDLVDQHHAALGFFAEVGAEAFGVQPGGVGQGDGFAEGLEVDEVVGAGATGCLVDVGRLEVGQGIVGVEQVAGRGGGFGIKNEWLIGKVEIAARFGQFCCYLERQAGFAGAGFAGEERGCSSAIATSTALRRASLMMYFSAVGALTDDVWMNAHCRMVLLYWSIIFFNSNSTSSM